MAAFLEIFTGSLLGCLLGYFIVNIGDKGTEKWFAWDTGEREECREFQRYEDMLKYLRLHGWRTLHYHETHHQSYESWGDSGVMTVPRIIREHFCQQTPTSKLLAWIWRSCGNAAEWLLNEKN